MSAPIPPFTLRQLGYLLAASDAGSIVDGAAALHISPSALSDAITELERAVGEQLCVRRRAHGLTLTATGVEFAHLARELLQHADTYQDSVARRSGELVGPVTIGCYPTLAPVVLPPLLQEFDTRHPGVRISVIEASQDRLNRALADGDIDVGVMYDTLITGKPERAVLYKNVQYVVVGAGHPLAERGQVTLEELADEDLVLLDAPPSAEHTLALFAERGLRPRIRFRVVSYETVRAVVGRDIGYSILVSRAGHPFSLEGRELRTLELSPAPSPVAIDVMWTGGRARSVRADAVVAFLQRHFAVPPAK